MAIFKNIGKGAASIGRRAAKGYLNYSNALLPQTALLPRAAFSGLKDIVAGAYGEDDPTVLPTARNRYTDPREYAASQLLTQPAARQPVVTTQQVQTPKTPVSPSTVQPYQGLASMLDDTVNNRPQQVSTQQSIVDMLTGAATSPEAQASPDSERRPYAYQQPAVTNAFTMGAPADDIRSRLMAATAVKKFNAAEELLKSNKTPEAEAAYKAAQDDANKWGKWAALTPNARQQLLMQGERDAGAGQGREKFATLRNEMDTPGAAELLSYAAKVNAGQIDASGNPLSKYGSGQVTGYVPKGTRTAQSGINDYLNTYDPYDKRVDWSTQPNEAGLTDDQIIKRAGGSASAAAKLADLRAMQRRQYLSDRNLTAASLLTGK